MPNIVVIDGKTLNPGDLSWDPLYELGKVEIYDQSTSADGIDRMKSAEIVLTNKFVMDEDLLAKLPLLKCICVTATGYNIVDMEAARKRNIVVCNASGYSTPSTAQHAIALLLELSNQCGDYNHSVSRGDWTKSGDWTYTRKPTIELAGLTLGIVGVGVIGKQVATVARALGMNIIGHNRSQSSGKLDGSQMVSLEELYETADVISLHCPLNSDSHEMINMESLSKMKNTAFLINTGRGGLINEADLKSALESGLISGAGLDVLQNEPPLAENPLIGLSNCIITPHVAWGSKAARSRLLNITIANLNSFICGQPQNCVS